jgi:hypothetical protein
MHILRRRRSGERNRKRKSRNFDPVGLLHKGLSCGQLRIGVNADTNCSGPSRR